MIKIYKGNPIIITKSINGRGSFMVTFQLYYRYSFFKFRKYEQTIKLSETFTMKDAYETLKQVIDDIDNTIKF